MKFYFRFLLFIVVGFYSIAGAALEWEWFMDHPKAKIFARLLGRTGIRIFYILLGVGVLIFLVSLGCLACLTGSHLTNQLDHSTMKAGEKTYQNLKRSS